MTISEAALRIRAYEQNLNPTAEDDAAYVEALEFMINEHKDGNAICTLGGYYYERRQFDKALAYYNKAADGENIQAHTGLGYIWYYGRTGKTDYKKAYENFVIAADQGDINAIYKIADMYRNGYYVEKDLKKYKEIIEDLYKRINTNEYEWFHLPEVCARLSKIRKDENQLIEAVDLLVRARRILEYRLQGNPFFGDLTEMKYIINDLYKLIVFDPTNFSFYDLYYLLEKPQTVSFKYNRRPFTVKADDGLAIRFEEEWYRDINDFFKRATINGKRITSLYNSLYDFTVES